MKKPYYNTVMSGQIVLRVSADLREAADRYADLLSLQRGKRVRLAEALRELLIEALQEKAKGMV